MTNKLLVSAYAPPNGYWNISDPTNKHCILNKPSNDDIYTDNIQDLGDLSGTININPSLGNGIKLKLTGNSIINITDSSIGSGYGRTITIELYNGGAYNLEFGSNIHFPNGGVPVLSSTGMDIITLNSLDNGSSWYGTVLSDLTPPVPPNPREWDWSQYTSDPTYTIVDGRQFVRHPSNMGTVMSFNDGTERSVLVLDAQYRKPNGYAYYTDWGYDINGHLSGDMKLDLCQQFGYAFGSSVSTLPFTGMSDTDINTLYSTICNQDSKGSKYNTDSLFSLGANAQAANYCRSILVNGEGCDLPNFNTLVRIYASMIQLDSMDPTKGSYPNLMLSNWFDINYYCWSSSWCGDYWGSYFAMYLGYLGDCFRSSQNPTIYSVAPCLELINI